MRHRRLPGTQLIPAAENLPYNWFRLLDRTSSGRVSASQAWSILQSREPLSAEFVDHWIELVMREVAAAGGSQPLTWKELWDHGAERLVRWTRDAGIAAIPGRSIRISLPPIQQALRAGLVRLLRPGLSPATYLRSRLSTIDVVTLPRSVYARYLIPSDSLIRGALTRMPNPQIDLILEYDPYQNTQQMVAATFSTPGSHGCRNVDVYLLGQMTSLESVFRTLPESCVDLWLGPTESTAPQILFGTYNSTTERTRLNLAARPEWTISERRLLELFRRLPAEPNSVSILALILPIIGPPSPALQIEFVRTLLRMPAIPHPDTELPLEWLIVGSQLLTALEAGGETAERAKEILRTQSWMDQPEVIAYSEAHPDLLNALDRIADIDEPDAAQFETLQRFLTSRNEAEQLQSLAWFQGHGVYVSDHLLSADAWTLLRNNFEWLHPRVRAYLLSRIFRDNGPTLTDRDIQWVARAVQDPSIDPLTGRLLNILLAPTEYFIPPDYTTLEPDLLEQVLARLPESRWPRLALQTRFSRIEGIMAYDRLIGRIATSESRDILLIPLKQIQAADPALETELGWYAAQMNPLQNRREIDAWIRILHLYSSHSVADRIASVLMESGTDPAFLAGLVRDYPSERVLRALRLNRAFSEEARAILTQNFNGFATAHDRLRIFLEVDRQPTSENALRILNSYSESDIDELVHRIVLVSYLLQQEWLPATLFVLEHNPDKLALFTRAIQQTQWDHRMRPKLRVFAAQWTIRHPDDALSQHLNQLDLNR